MEFTITELAVPESLDSPAGIEFAATIELRNAVEAEMTGTDFLSYTPAEMLPVWQNQRYEPKRGLVARVGDHIVARAVFEVEAERGAEAAFIEIEVLPEFRRHGIGTALLERLRRWSLDDDRGVMQAFTMYRPHSSGAQITAPTGFGSVPSTAAGTRFLRRNGFTLEQVERISVLALPIDQARLAELETMARSLADPEYRVISWRGRTPIAMMEAMASLRQRMSVDVPAAGMGLAEQEWDLERIATNDEIAERSTRTLLTTAAQHIATGALVGYTELSVPEHPDRPVDQGDTLVLRSHRGRSLGLLLKLANLRQLLQGLPGHPAIVTFNAEENRHMLEVNEMVGFVPAAYEAAWRKTIAL